MPPPKEPNPLALIPFIGSNSPSAITLGRVRDDNGLAELRDAGETHVLLFGPNGSGKMTRVLAPNLLRLRNRSIFVIDPKGELAAITAQRRRNMGDEVIIINPFGELIDIPGYEDLKSNGFNPLLTLDPDSDSFNADADVITEALIKVENQHQPHFDHAARALVTALIMHVVVASRKVEEPFTPSLSDVRDLLGLSNTELAEFAKGLAGSEHRGIRNKAAQFTDLTDEIRGVVSSARTQLAWMDDQEIALDLSAEDEEHEDATPQLKARIAARKARTNHKPFNLREAKEHPCTVYLILPHKHVERHKRWLRLVVSTALNAMMRPRRPGEPRVLFMMDEFPVLGHMEIVESAWALVRGYGIQMMPVFQDMAQLRDIYKERADSFIGMAGAIAHFPPNDATTAQWIIDRAGKVKIYVRNSNEGQSIGEKKSRSFGSGTKEEWIPRYTPQDLYGAAPGTLFLSLSGQRDMLEGAVPNYYNINAYIRVARRNPYVPKEE